MYESESQFWLRPRRQTVPSDVSHQGLFVNANMLMLKPDAENWSWKLRYNLKHNLILLRAGVILPKCRRIGQRAKKRLTQTETLNASHLCHYDDAQQQLLRATSGVWRWSICNVDLLKSLSLALGQVRGGSVDNLSNRSSQSQLHDFEETAQIPSSLILSDSSGEKVSAATTASTQTFGRTITIFLQHLIGFLFGDHFRFVIVNVIESQFRSSWDWLYCEEG